MTSARRSKSLAAALFAAALALAVTVATATAFAEASPQDNAAGPAFAPGTMTAADGEETIDHCVPGDDLDVIAEVPAGAWYDGGSSGGTAASTKPASSTSKGSAASAKTGDALPIAAVCILVVLGLVVAIVAYRKSRK